jgi:hypothetical protein
VEETAEQILARLERYAASLRERPGYVPANGSGALVGAGVGARTGSAPKRSAAVDTLIPSHTESTRQLPRFLAEVAPGVLATASCVFVILMFEWIGHAFAIVLAGLLLVVGVLGLVRRVPCAGALTIGVLIASLLIHFS